MEPVIPYNSQPRRQDRAISDQDWMIDLLQRTPFGVLAIAPDGQPYAHPILFAHHAVESAIYLHSANQGRTISEANSGAEACFTVAEMGRLLPAPRSRGFSVEYASVVIFGRLEVLTTVAGQLHGLRLLMAKYAPHLKPGHDYAVLGEDELAGVVVYRLVIAAWSGKRKQAPPDFPGAYKFADSSNA